VRRGIDPDTILVDPRETDPAIREMARRTRLVGDGERQAPDVGPGGAVVDVRTRDGRTFREVVPRVPRPGHEPADRAAIAERFLVFATTRLPRDLAQRVFGVVNALDELDDAAELAEILAVEEE
jgi:hypothetical protein